MSFLSPGSIQETLGLKKPLLVVVNESLMDCHQYELAQKMEEEGHLYYCTCDTLLKTLQEKDFTKLIQLPPADRALFGLYVDKLVGFDT